MRKTVAHQAFIPSRRTALPLRSGSGLEHEDVRAALFDTVLNSLSQGLAVFDADLRLILFNRSYVDLFEYPPGFIKTGIGFEDILRFNLSRGEFGRDVDAEQYARDSIERARTDARVTRNEHVRPNGTVLALRRVALPEGGFINTYIDITERKKAEAQARHNAEVLQAAVDNMAAGIRVFDKDLKLTTWNRLAFEMLDFPQEFARVGTPYTRFLDYAQKRGDYKGEQRGSFDEKLARARNPIIADVEHELPNGRVIQKRRDPMPGGGFISTFVDVTERGKAERALRDSESRMRAVLGHAADAIATIGAGGTILSLNPAGEKIFGYSEKEIVGKKAHVLIPFIGTWKTDERVVQSREAMGCHKDGTPIPLEVSVARASLSAEEIDVLILRDITRQKEMHAQLLHTSKLATVGQMAAGLAHEMNQPLNVMRMAADNLLIRMERGHNDPEFLRDNLELIGQQAERVGKMTLHLRVFARLDAVNLEPFDPVKSVCAAADLMEQQLTLENIRFEKRIQDHCPPVVGHPSQLEQVVINLLTNAKDAIVDHPRPRKDAHIGRVVLTMSEDPSKRTVVIRVGDTGGGIPRNIRDRVFDPFFTTKEVGRGTGLGLSICSTIVAEMKGKIEIADTPEGVEMVVTIPTHSDEEQNDG